MLTSLFWRHQRFFAYLKHITSFPTFCAQSSGKVTFFLNALFKRYLTITSHAPIRGTLRRSHCSVPNPRCWKFQTLNPISHVECYPIWRHLGRKSFGTLKNLEVKILFRTEISLLNREKRGPSLLVADQFSLHRSKFSFLNFFPKKF